MMRANFDKYHDQTKIKVSVKRNMLKTVQHKTVLDNTNVVFRKRHVFSIKNFKHSDHKVRDTWTSVAQLKSHSFPYYRHVSIINSEKNTVRRLNDESIWSKMLHSDRFIRTRVILKIKLSSWRKWIQIIHNCTFLKKRFTCRIYKVLEWSIKVHRNLYRFIEIKGL